MYVHMYIFLLKGTLGLHINSAHFSNFDLAFFVIHRIDSFLWLFLLEFFFRRTVRSQREREWWTLFPPAALHPGMSVPHRDLFPYQSDSQIPVLEHWLPEKVWPSDFSLSVTKHKGQTFVANSVFSFFSFSFGTYHKLLQPEGVKQLRLAEISNRSFKPTSPPLHTQSP